MPVFYKKNSTTVLSKKVRFFAVLFIATLLSLKSFAVVYNVTNTTDGLALNQLRGAILAADAAGPGPHTINVAAGTYTLTLGQITFGNNPQTIFIVGAGAATTIINMTGPLASRDRIFFINPSGTTNSPVISITGITFQGAYLNSDPFGGAAICAGGGSAESLTVTNCIFDSNTLPANAYGGAAICMQVRGDLTVDNCTFTNNVSNDADGGAVLFIPYNSGLGNGQGNLSVTNSTFTNNSVVFPGAGTSNGGALAFTGPGGAVFFSVTINNNTFTNNTADGLGGAISANNSPNLNIPQIHYNRFVNNTSSASALSSGLHFVESSGSVNAENNWWGCNTNPVSGASTAPCNQAGGDVAGGGALDANPWLQLRTTASPTPICNSTPTTLGNTSTITTSILNNSDGTAIPVANLNRLIGLPVTWTSTLGSLSGQQATIQAAGTATATFTSNGTAGTATVNAQIDNVPSGETTPARASITVNVTSVAPTGATGVTTVCSGGSTTLTVSGGIKGTGASTQWFTGSCGGTLVFTGDAFSTGALVATTNYFVRYNGTCNTTTCATVTVNVNDVTGGTVGTDQTVCSGGDPAAFTESVASTGSGTLTYQWQSSTTSCAAGFSNIAGATGTTYDPPSGLAVTTYYRRVTISTLNAVPCTANSNCITVTVNNVTGGTVAADQTICSGGDPAAFTQSVASTGSGALTYQWQSSTTSCAAGFSDIGGATSTTYDAPSGVTVTTYYRRVTTSTLSGVPCTANSNCITVSVNDVTGGTVGSDQIICSGGNPALFTQSVASTGSGTLTYQWQSSTTSCAAGFGNIGGATATTYDPPAGLTQTTYYRRVTTSTLNAVACTANSNCITVTVNAATITVTNPATTTGFANAPFSQTFTASGGIAPYTFSTASLLPTGLTLSPAGVLSGTPTATGTFNIVVTATDAGGCIGTGANYPLVINPNACGTGSQVTQLGSPSFIYQSNTITGFTIPAGTNRLLVVTASDPAAINVAGVTFGGTPMTKQAQETDGFFAVDAIYTLPLASGGSSSGDIVVSGGSANKFITATVFQFVDQVTPVADKDSIQLTPNPPSPNTLTLTSAANDLAFDIFDYYTTASAANTAAVGGGQTFIINQGPLNLGVGLGFAYYSTSMKNGAAPTVAMQRFVNAPTVQEALIHVAVNIKAGATVITVTNPGVTTGVISTPFSQTFTASGGTGPYTFTTFSALPAGLTLSAAGVLSGTPTVTGTFPIVVSATDANGCFGNGPTYNLVISNCPVITVTNPGVTTGTAGTAFSQTFTASGGTAPYTFTTASTLPTGLTLSPGGVLSGTPTQTGTFPIVVTATATGGCTGNGPTYNLVISCQTITVTNPVNTNGTAGTAFSETFTSANTIGAVTYTTSSTLPTGLTLSAGGVLSGTPTQAGTFPIVVIVTDANGCTGTGATYNLVISCPAPITGTATPASQSLCSGVPITAIVLGGAPAGATYNWTRDNPGVTGTIANAGSGNISGTLINSTAAPITVTFTITPTYYGTCTGTTYTATVTVNPNPAAFAIGGAGTFCPTGNTLTGPVDPNYTYQWNRSYTGFTGTFVNIAGANGQTYAATASGVYQLVVTNQFGCTASDTAIVHVADYVFIGSLGAGDAQQTGRINRFAVVSTCAAPKACPGIFTAVGARFYDSYTITNIRNAPVCATIGIQSGCGTNIFNVAYLTSFNPASPCTNYLGDPGSSFTASGFMEVTIPALGTIVVVVHEVNVGAGCANYTLTVDVPREATSISANPGTTSCSGAPITLTANGAANSYLWNPGGATTQSILVSAIGTTNYTVTYGYGNNGCTDSKSQSVTIVNPTVNPVANQAACNGANVTVNFTGSDPGATYNWTNTNTAIGLAASGSGNLNFTATNGTLAPISGTITVTPVNGPCSGTPVSFTITVASQPTVTSVTGAVICEPGGVVNLSATGNGTINWYDASTGGVVVNTGNTYSPNITSTTTFYLESLIPSGPQTLLGMPAQSNTFPGNVRGYWFTAPTDFVITSLSVPTTASSGPQSIAVVKFNGNVPPPVFSATTNAFTTHFLTRNNVAAGSIPCNIPVLAGEVIGFLGYRGTINSYAPGDFNTTIAGFPVQLQRLGMQLPLTTNNPQNIWREFGPGTSISRIEFEYSVAQTCISAPRVPVTATVNPLPVATATPSSQTICTGSAITTIALTSTVPGTVFNWTRDNTVSVTGIAASGAGDISGSLTNTTNAPVTVTFTITPSYTNAGVTCTGTPITATVVVNPIPNSVATPSSQTICSGSAITTIVLSGNVAGTVYNWTRDNTVAVTGIAASGAGNIAGTLTNTTFAPVTVTFTITPSYTNAGVTCTGPSITATVVVNPIPDAVATPSSQTICSGSAITTIALTGSVPGTVFSWTRDNNANVIGIASSGSGSASISGSLTNLTNAPVTVTFTITPSFTNAGVTCTGPSITATVVVNPIPNAVATPAAQTTCSGSAITTIALTGNVAGTVYNWTRDNNATVTGIAASGSGNISGSLTNTTNAPVTVTFTITPGYTNAGVTCTGAPITATVVVNPIPNAVATPAAQTICSGSSITNIVLTGNVVNTIFNWTRDNTGTVTGIGANGTGDIGGSLVNTTNAPVTVTFTITPGYTNAGVTCTGTPITATVIVNPIPNAVATPSAQTICSGSAITTIALTGNVAGTVFSWTRNSTVLVTGIAASGTGNISGSLTNTTTSPITVTFTITPSYTNAGVTCTGANITATVVVNPIPNAVANPTAQTICSGSSIVPIVISGNVSGTVFNWTRNNTVAVTGIAASGSGNISGILTNTTNAPVTVTFTITPSFTNAGVTCTGTPITVTVIVNPIPNAVATPVSQTICSGTAITTIVLTGNVAGTVYNWTRDNTGPVPGIPGSGTGNINGVLTNVSNIPRTVTFTITPSYTNAGVTCTGIPITATVLVNPTPNAVAAPPQQTICSGNSINSINLNGSVSGTTFNWTRDNTITVTGIPASGSGNISGALTNTTNAPITVTFTIIPTANGCPGPSITATVLVNPTPNAVATPSSQTICSGTAMTTIVMTGNVAGTTYSWNRDNITTVGGVPAAGNGNISGVLTSNVTTQVTVTFTITPRANNCSGPPITATVVVNPTPTIVCPANIIVNAIPGTCNADVVYPPAVVTGVPAPTVTYSIPSGSSFPVGVTTVTATASNICGTVSCTFTITVLDVRVPLITTAPVNRAVCVGSNTSFSVVATNTVSYQWQSGNGILWGNIVGATSPTLTLNNVPMSMNNSLIRVVLTGPCGTVVNSVPVTLVVNPLPLVTLSSASNPVLLPGRTVTINANVSPAGGSFAWLFNGSPMSGVTGSSVGPLDVLNVGSYSVIYTDLNGCVNTSSPFVVSAGFTDYLWVYPNPNTGQFNVRFYNITGEMATLKIFNYLGQVVHTQTLVLGVAYSNFLIDMRRHAAGLYTARIVNGSGAELAAKRLMIYHP